MPSTGTLATGWAVAGRTGVDSVVEAGSEIMSRAIDLVQMGLLT